jgi:hypothetical protein
MHKTKTGEKVRLLGMDTCPNLNDIMEIRCNKCINNPQGMKLRRFKNRTPARFEYIYCTLFPLCHSN